jgi:hypothetical protein
VTSQPERRPSPGAPRRQWPDDPPASHQRPLHKSARRGFEAEVGKIVILHAEVVALTEVGQRLYISLPRTVCTTAFFKCSSASAYSSGPAASTLRRWMRLELSQSNGWRPTGGTKEYERAAALGRLRGKRRAVA